MNIVVDLEHTISNAWHRIDKRNSTGGLHLRKDFQEEFINDRPNNNVITFMKQLTDNDHHLTILSAKKEKYKFDIVNWLRLHKVEYNALVLKPDSCTLSSDEFKEQCIKGFSQKIDFALDDVGKNCAMFARNNIPCLRIEQR